MIAPQKIEHVGLRLWLASQQWQDRFKSEMVAAGHPWFAEAQAALVPHIDREGTSQSDLTARLGLSKQAVQQLIDNLVQSGVVERRLDPADARVRRVHFTKQGLRVLADANTVKRRIELDYADVLGSSGLLRLNSALEKLLSQKEADALPSGVGIKPGARRRRPAP
jgi:DNA-binding MarR family transcriptional regulator